MTWWIWILIGLSLVFVEVITPGGFYMLFFGVGALAVGLLALADLAGPAWLQVLLFSIVSVCALWLFREKLMQSFQSKAQNSVDSYIGETGHAVDEIAVNAVGKVELRGTAWSARNVGATSLSTGSRCVVERVEGLTLVVRAKNR